ncbi:MAG: hypothetical protein ACFFD4_07725 [Candidatus Odinarchaeota archaeon]
MKIRITKLDKLFSELVRRKSGGYCERCGKRLGWQNLQTSHFWGRRAKSVRWDEDNACALCFYCHKHFGENPHVHVAWFQQRLGKKRYDALMGRLNDMTKVDKDAIEADLKNKISQLGG